MAPYLLKHGCVLCSAVLPLLMEGCGLYGTPEPIVPELNF